MGLTLMEGNEAVARGAVAAGCRFFAGYPITPATPIFNAMLQLLPPMGGICIQGEDEIASIGACLGAAMTGVKVMTATSGPGISLYSEHISFAVGSEIPLVVVDVQRLGPSTGSATKGADGDIQFMRWGSSGGLPVIVLAPTDVADCFTLTMTAFNLAETYRCPVFLASNKEVAQTRESVDFDALERPAVVDRRPADQHEGVFRPFAVTDSRMVPDFLPIGHHIPVRQTSSTHGADGYITTDPGEIAAFQQRLMDKLTTAVDSFSYHRFHPAAGSDTLVITYGVTARTARDALGHTAAGPPTAALLELQTLWPVPETLLRTTARSFKRVVVAEMNLGQYVHEVRRVLGGRPVSFLGRMDGQLITPEQIERTASHG